MIGSNDLGKLSFKKLPINGEFRYLMGEPSENVAIIISGEAGAGKSTYAIRLARHLAQSGSTCYVAAEEFMSPTLVDKLHRAGGGHDSLNFVEKTEHICPKAKHIFIDSAQTAGMEPEDWEKLRKKHHGKMFTVVLQNTKDGQYRGGAAWRHNADVHIEITMEHIKTTKNRFGELRSVKNTLFKRSEK